MANRDIQMSTIKNFKLLLLFREFVRCMAKHPNDPILNYVSFSISIPHARDRINGANTKELSNDHHSPIISFNAA